MRIYKRVVIEIASGKVLEADSYEYKGPVAKAKGGGSTSTTTTELPAWLRPYATDFINVYANQAFERDAEGHITDVRQQPEGMDQKVAGFNPMQDFAMTNIANMTGGMQGAANMGVGQSAATLGGSFLHPGSNPYLQATYDQAARGLTDQYSTAVAPSIMAAAQKSGNMGGSAFQEAMALSRYNLGENLGNLATDIYGGNYAAERDRQLQTLNMLPNTLQAGYMPQQTLLGIGSMQQGQEQTVLDTDYMNALNESQYPFELLSGFGGALGQAGMGSGTSRTRAGSSGGMFGKAIGWLTVLPILMQALEKLA